MKLQKQPNSPSSAGLLLRLVGLGGGTGGCLAWGGTGGGTSESAEEGAVRDGRGRSSASRETVLGGFDTATAAEEEEDEEEEEEDEEEVEKPSVKFMAPEGGIPSPQLRCFESESSSTHEVAAESRPSEAAQAQLNLSFDASHTPVRSTDTTLEYYDAPLSEEQEGEEGHTAAQDTEEVVTMYIKVLTETEEENSSPTTEQTPLPTSEDVEREEEEMYEEVMESGLEQEGKNEEVQCEKADELDVDLSSKQEEAATLEQEDTSSQNHGNPHLISTAQNPKIICSQVVVPHMTLCLRLVCNQVTETTDSGNEIESQDQTMTATGQEAQSDVTQATEYTEHLNPPGATESTHDLEEELEQSTGPSLNETFDVI